MIFQKGNKIIDASKLINTFKADEDDPVMLVNYCTKRVATVGGDGYSESVLYQRKDGSCEIHYYSKYEGDAEETHRAYSVDKSAIDAVYDIINKNKIVPWKEKYSSPGMTGGEIILKFRTGSGEYTRVTSENMPGKGITVLSETSSVLADYANKGSVIQ